MIGEKFHQMLVLEDAGSDKRGAKLWKCLCDCGKKKVVAGKNLRSGAIKSCGCLPRQALIKSRTVHGGRNTKAYGVWKSMKERCLNSRHPSFAMYGGRGIKVCSRWMRFENFLADMGQPPAGRSLDRIDNNKGYEPKNCRWATPAEQTRNRRNALPIDLMAIAAQKGITYGHAYNLYKGGKL